MCINYNDIRFRILFLLLVFYLFAFAEELPTTAFGLILTQTLNVSPSTQTWYYTAAFTTFSFQPLFAVIAQFLSLYTCIKQKFFAVTGIIIGGAMYIMIGSSKPDFGYLFLFTIILNIGLAFCNAIIDGISVEISNYFKYKNRNEPLLLSQNHQIQTVNEASSFNFGSAASIQSLSYFFRSCGSLSSAAMLIGLNKLDNYAVITLTGIIYLAVVLPFLLLLFPRSRINLQIEASQDGEGVDKKPMTLMDELNKYVNIISTIWRCLLFVFFLNIPPTITDVFYVFIYSRWYFTKQQYRIFNFMSLVGSVLGGLIYFLFLSKYCENKRYLSWIFISMQLLNCLFGLIFVPISNLSNSFENDASLRSIYGIPFGYAISAILLLDTLTSSLVLMPQLSLAAQMSPLRLETSVFACFIGVSHLGQLASAAISSLLLKSLNVKEEHWDNLTIYIIICCQSGLIPLFGLMFLKRVKQDDIEGVLRMQDVDQMRIQEAHIHPQSQSVTTHNMHSQ